MADQPMVPDTSYSDPIYDRLEIIMDILAKRWLLVVILFGLSAVSGLLIQQARLASPAAGSAQRFIKAQGDESALVALTTDTEEVNAEFRAQACLALVQMALDREASEEALTYAEQGLALISAEEHAHLRRALQLAQAAALRESGERTQALDVLVAVERTAIDDDAQRLEAQINQATIHAELAQLKPDEAAEHEEQALAILEPLRGASDRQARSLTDLARFLYFDIKRRQTQPAPAAESPAAESPAEALPAVDTPAEDVVPDDTPASE